MALNSLTYSLFGWRGQALTKRAFFGEVRCCNKWGSILKTLIRISGLVAALAFGASAQAGVNLVVNGDFSAPNTNGGWGVFAPAVTGWTNSAENGGFVEIGASNIYGLQVVGNGQNLEVNGNTFGNVSQTINGLTPGRSYLLSYLYGGRPGGGVQTLTVSIGGSSQTDTGSMGVWTQEYLRFTATSSSEILTFASAVTSGIPSYGNEITNVAVSAPELSTWAMMLAGFGALAFAGYRRNKAVAAA
jgi:hypothetical protein